MISDYKGSGDLYMNDFKVEARRTLTEARHTLAKQTERDAKISMAFGMLAVVLFVFSIVVKASGQ